MMLNRLQAEIDSDTDPDPDTDWILDILLYPLAVLN